MKKNNILSYEDLKNDIIEYNKKYPYYRWGQAVFNYIDITFNLANEIQYVYNIDCFYNDDNADAFMLEALKIINKEYD